MSNGTISEKDPLFGLDISNLNKEGTIQLAVCYQVVFNATNAHQPSELVQACRDLLVARVTAEGWGTDYNTRLAAVEARLGVVY